MPTSPFVDDWQALAAALRLNFALFLRFAVREIGGEGEYMHNWHIDAIAHELDRLASGELTRSIITVPPRHLKSVTVTVAWVAWMLGHSPAVRFICVSYGQRLADKHARDCLRIIQSPWFQLAFPSFVLMRHSVSDFETSAGGGRLSTSLEGVLTGRGADIIILDDPLKADDAQSELARNSAAEWFENSLLSRLNSHQFGRIIVVMQRLHEADLAGVLLERGGFHELRLPAIATADEKIPIGNGLVYQRYEGRALHEERVSLATLHEIQARNSYVFAAQQQQEPVPREGNLVQPSWFKTYDEPPSGGVVVQSWDTAVKTGVRNDWSVGITAVYYQKRYYILDVFRARVTFGDLRKKLDELCRIYKVERLLIEDASSGQELIQLLHEDLPDGVPRPIAITPLGDKLARFEAQATRIEAGEVVLPQAAPWKADFVAEVAARPGGRHDDQSDALAQMMANPPPTLPPSPLAGPESFDGMTWSNGLEDYGLDDPWKDPSEAPDDPWA